MTAVYSPQWTDRMNTMTAVYSPQWTDWKEAECLDQEYEVTVEIQNMK